MCVCVATALIYVNCYCIKVDLLQLLSYYIVNISTGHCLTHSCSQLNLGLDSKADERIGQILQF